MTKYSLALVACAFAFVFAVPAVYAVEETANTTETTEAVTTSATPTVPTPPTTPPSATKPGTKPGMVNANLLERYRAMLKKGIASSTKGTARGYAKRYATANSSCIQKAVDTREASIATAWGTLSTAITSALSVRQKALFDAWGGSEDGRGAAIKAAWDAWKKAHRDAFSKLRTDRTSAWKTFRDTVKAECKIALPKEEEVAKDAAGSTAL